jgi:hypothetical protein
MKDIQSGLTCASLVYYSEEELKEIIQSTRFLFACHSRSSSSRRRQCESMAGKQKGRGSREGGRLSKSQKIRSTQTPVLGNELPTLAREPIYGHTANSFKN